MLFTRAAERSWRYDQAFPLYARLPVPLAYRLAGWQSAYFYHQREREREAIRTQMQQVFPAADSACVDSWVHDYFCMVEQEALDTWFLDKPVVTEFVSLSGFEAVLAARAQGQKVLLTGGHYGRFWMAGPVMRHAGQTVGTITRDGSTENVHGLHPAEHRYRLFKLEQLQKVLGGPFLVEGDDLRPLYRALDQHLITLIFDVPYVELPSGCVTVPFLGGSIRVPAGIYRIAKKIKAVVAPFHIRDLGGGKIVVEFSQLLSPFHYDDEGFMSLLAHQLELRIEARPGHWWLWEALPLLRRQ